MKQVAGNEKWQDNESYTPCGGIGTILIRQLEPQPKVLVLHSAAFSNRLALIRYTARCLVRKSGYLESES